MDEPLLACTRSLLGTNEPNAQTQRVKRSSVFSVPIKHQEIRVARKPGDRVWMGASVSLSMFLSFPFFHLLFFVSLFHCICGVRVLHVVRVVSCPVRDDASNPRDTDVLWSQTTIQRPSVVVQQGE